MRPLWWNAVPCRAGVIGKIYTNWMRDRGGVAIDIGAAVDLWAGRATRGEKRGLNAIDETYKLWTFTPKIQTGKVLHHQPEVWK